MINFFFKILNSLLRTIIETKKDFSIGYIFASLKCSISNSVKTLQFFHLSLAFLILGLGFLGMWHFL